ncbi:MAG TPA: hypothetical protein VFB00_04995 [Terriglobales bacterium]|nr:hypothetical protein [Terriglobales bacterium]
MKMLIGLIALLLVSAQTMRAAARPHVVALGKWTTVSLPSDDRDGKTLSLKIRPLLVDGRSKEFTVGPAHEVTDRTFVVQRAYRLNDSLPQETGATRWRWERGEWLLVDGTTGTIHQITLPAFDPYLSVVSWFRDYAAYCTVAGDGKKSVALLVQLGKRKPLLKQTLGDLGAASSSVPACPAPVWQRSPARVTFEQATGQKITFTVTGRAVETAPAEQAQEEE